jgi:CheY-like chemotaxis protein
VQSKIALIVEDEALVGLVLQSTLTELGYSVPKVIGTGRGAIEFARENHVDLILMDIRLADDVDGIDAAKTINRGIPVVFHTAYSDKPTIDRARRLNPLAILEKPVTMEKLQEVLREFA